MADKVYLFHVAARKRKEIKETDGQGSAFVDKVKEIFTCM